MTRDNRSFIEPTATELQDAMMGAAERVKLPDRFRTTPDGNGVIIRDKYTGLQTRVALCHYSGVRQVLQALFPDSTE